MTDTKATNPKDGAASNRLPLHLTPASIRVCATLPFVEGDCKYEPYNWREAGARASVYYDSVGRHLELYWNGEWADPKTGIPHIYSALAGLGVMVDCSIMGNLVDDRPPASPQLCDLIRSSEQEVKRIREVFAVPAEAPKPAFKVGHRVNLTEEAMDRIGVRASDRHMLGTIKELGPEWAGVKWGGLSSVCIYKLSDLVHA